MRRLPDTRQIVHGTVKTVFNLTYAFVKSDSGIEALTHQNFIGKHMAVSDLFTGQRVTFRLQPSRFYDGKFIATEVQREK